MDFHSTKLTNIVIHAVEKNTKMDAFTSRKIPLGILTASKFTQIHTNDVWLDSHLLSTY